MINIYISFTLSMHHNVTMCHDAVMYSVMNISYFFFLSSVLPLLIRLSLISLTFHFLFFSPHFFSFDFIENKFLLYLHYVSIRLLLLLRYIHIYILLLFCLFFSLHFSCTPNRYYCYRASPFKIKRKRRRSKIKAHLKWEMAIVFLK